MGIDEAMAALCSDGTTLRFYTWDAPTLSIGYAQRSGDIDLVACRAAGVSVVRRPTGGRAVLHRCDLTYSLIAPLRPPWVEISIAESYRVINRCLRRGLERVGVDVRPAGRHRQTGGLLTPFCFSATSPDGLLADKKKIIGSAQRRFPAALLQQGSVLLDFHPDDLLQCLRPDHRSAAAGSLKTIGSLREVLGRLPGRPEVEAAIRLGFAEEMGVEFVEGELERHEIELAAELAAARYGAADWTFRR